MLDHCIIYHFLVQLNAPLHHAEQLSLSFFPPFACISLFFSFISRHVSRLLSFCKHPNTVARLKGTARYYFMRIEWGWSAKELETAKIPWAKNITHKEREEGVKDMDLFEVRDLWRERRRDIVGEMGGLAWKRERAKERGSRN